MLLFVSPIKLPKKTGYFVYIGLLLSTLSGAQTLSKERFVANNNTVVWTETIEVKDIDTPIIVETLTEALKQKDFIQLDQIQQQGILSGTIRRSSIPKLSSARFQIDFLYESYIVTVSDIMVKRKAIEVYLLKKDGSFKPSFPKFIHQIEEKLSPIFFIK